jgi:hypothetical protein
MIFGQNVEIKPHKFVYAKGSGIAKGLGNTLFHY